MLWQKSHDFRDLVNFFLTKRHTRAESGDYGVRRQGCGSGLRAKQGVLRDRSTGHSSSFAPGAGLCPLRPLVPEEGDPAQRRQLLHVRLRHGPARPARIWRRRLLGDARAPRHLRLHEHLHRASVPSQGRDRARRQGRGDRFLRRRLAHHPVGRDRLRLWQHRHLLDRLPARRQRHHAHRFLPGAAVDLEDARARMPRALDRVDRRLWRPRRRHHARRPGPPPGADGLSLAFHGPARHSRRHVTALQRRISSAGSTPPGPSISAGARSTATA